MATVVAHSAQEHPVGFDVDYPDRPLDRLSTAFRPLLAIPIVVVLATVSGSTAATAGGVLFLAPLLMIVFATKYPRWWFDWNLQLLRFTARVGVYLALLDDRYPSTDDEQAVHLDMPYPDVRHGEVNRWLPLVKWFLAIPHYVVLALLWLGVVAAVLAAWVTILFTGRYPRALFGFVVGVARWHVRVVAYAFALTTDVYPPFRLGA